ncbi:hypothetical protein JV173_02720 [Acholeplasma equirhinis]|uniref:hypothetical protein n=1 Tax=Acholeplasma equirhinis TaxID=555393 RepID=UPI00197A7C48|nr:hypothetical protein [Acholeplasma equirhinis]MBN3490422.1 hypothetical protein [Acholeplasma equirhinis]
MKRIVLFLIVTYLSFGLIGCQIDDLIDEDQDNTVVLGGEYQPESILSKLGETYFIRFNLIDEDDETVEYVIAKSGNIELYTSTEATYLFEGDKVYELDLEAETKTELPEYMFEILRLSQEITLTFMVEWAEDLGYAANFIKSETYLNRTVSIYEYNFGYAGTFIKASYTIDNLTKIALKFEYETNLGKFGWSVDEFKLSDINLTSYVAFESVESDLE